MIEQHQYGRIILDDGTLLDNYSTLAGSPGLKITHIEEYFEPLCKFAINIKQDPVCKKDLINDRRSLMIVPIPTGELLIGQISIYKFKENNAETCFIHNYILSSNEKLRYIKVPEKVFGVIQLDIGCNDKEESKLGILAAIPYEESNPYFRNKQGLLRKMGMDDIYFNKIIESIVIACHYDKRVWIATKGTGKEKELCIRALMYHIYRELPWHICERIGVITTAKWKCCCPNIHIAFLEEMDSYQDKEVGEDYLFDFINGKFFNLENTIDISFYLNFVKQNRSNKTIYEKLNAYILEITKVMGSSARRNINIYNYISIAMKVYMSRHHNMVYIVEKDEREGLLSGLVRILSLPIKIDMKKELQRLVVDVITSLEVDLKVGTLLDTEEVEGIVEILQNHIKDEAYEGVRNTLLINIRKAYEQKKYKYIQSLFEYLKEYIDINQYIVGELYKDDNIRNNVIYVQLKNKFEKCVDISGMMLVMQGAESIGELLIRDEYYKQLIESNTNIYISNTKDIYGLFMFVKTYCQSKSEESLNYVLRTVEKAFIRQIDFKHINTEEEILKLEFTQEYDDDNYIAIKQFKDHTKDIKNMSPDKLNVNTMVQERIKYLYRTLIRQDRYYMLVYAFLERSASRDDGWEINLNLAFEYIKQISVEDLLQFVIWLKGQKLYVDCENFDKEVIIFLINDIKSDGELNYKLVKRYFFNNKKIKPLYNKFRKAFIKQHIIFYNLAGRIKGEIGVTNKK